MNLMIINKIYHCREILNIATAVPKQNLIFLLISIVNKGMQTLFKV